MRLTRLEKERITDSRLKLQSVADTLKHVDPSKVRDYEEMQDCLEAAEHNLGGALRSDNSDQP
jgi:hypothetical protein